MNLRPLKQSIDHWLWSLGGRDVNGHQAPERKSRQMNRRMCLKNMKLEKITENKTYEICFPLIYFTKRPNKEFGRASRI